MQISTTQPLPAGRPKQSRNRDCPPRLKRRRSGDGFLYYFLHADGYQEPLGRDFDIALEGWKRLYSPGASDSPTGFKRVSEEFEKSEHFKSLAPNTQYDYSLGLARLRLVFKDGLMEHIRPKHVRQLKKEMVATKTQFNRFRSLISTLYWWATDDEELIECDNPTVGVSEYSTKPKKVKVTGAMYYAVYDEGPAVMKDWMDLDVIIGQRVSDVFTLKVSDIDAGIMSASHGKTAGVVELPIEDDLETVLKRIQGRERKVKSVYLVADEHGQPLTYWRLRTMFDDAKAAAKKKWEAAGREWIDWKRKDLRTKNATDADTLQQAQERLAHSDSRTTKSHYRLAGKAKPGRLPKR